MDCCRMSPARSESASLNLLSCCITSDGTSCFTKRLTVGNYIHARYPSRRTKGHLDLVTANQGSGIDFDFSLDKEETYGYFV